KENPVRRERLVEYGAGADERRGKAKEQPPGEILHDKALEVMVEVVEIGDQSAGQRERVIKVFRVVIERERQSAGGEAKDDVENGECGDKREMKERSGALGRFARARFGVGESHEKMKLRVKERDQDKDKGKDKEKVKSKVQKQGAGTRCRNK